MTNEQKKRETPAFSTAPQSLFIQAKPAEGGSDNGPEFIADAVSKWLALRSGGAFILKRAGSGRTATSSLSTADSEVRY